MSKFTDAELNEARAMINEALESLKAKGLVVRIRGGIVYTDNTFTCKLEANREGGLTREQEQYDVHRSYHQLPKRGTEVHFESKHFVIYGWNSRARKNKILLDELKTNKRYHISIPHFKCVV